MLPYHLSLYEVDHVNILRKLDPENMRMIVALAAKLLEEQSPAAATITAAIRLTLVG